MTDVVKTTATGLKIIEALGKLQQATPSEGSAFSAMTRTRCAKRW
ncbi:hypothetical protein [Bradyrhizobium sp. PRIMUS42]|nr:hypothetical protein [Bradyrhizobium sp. PRIMUS42]